MLYVVHHPGYVGPAPAGSGFAFDKYGLVMQALGESGVPLSIHAPEPMPRCWLEAMHDPAYVEEVATAQVPRVKEREIGYAITPRIATRAVLVPGGTWLAARLALAHGFAANSAGGSHHARRDTGSGYCVFNDLAVASNRLIAEGDVRRILIVDLDVHQGDGTARMLAGRDDVFTFSMHAAKNFPARKAASSRDVALPDGLEDADYLELLAAELPPIIDRFGPDLIFYQAGVDPHADDRLGRLGLTDAGLAARDRLVMHVARTFGVSVASTLGGGYGEDRLAIARRHASSMIALYQALGEPLATDLSFLR
jgi:acetoin utilization deacetylase AcuC-like enzyme